MSYNFQILEKFSLGHAKSWSWGREFEKILNFLFNSSHSVLFSEGQKNICWVSLDVIFHKFSNCFLKMPYLSYSPRYRGSKYSDRYRLCSRTRPAYHLMLELATWLKREHEEVGFYLAQALSGRGCFNAYLKRFKKRDEEMRCYCDFPVDNAEHALFVCGKWGVTRDTLGQAVGAELTPYTMVSLMLQSERNWTLIESFVTLVMKTRKLDGGRERKVEIASWPAPAVLHLGRTRLSAPIGGGILLFFPWLARLVGLPNRRVSADESPRRTDDGRVIRELKLE